MTGSEMNPKVDFFFNKASQWKEEYGKLRTILLGCQLTEELKWGGSLLYVSRREYRSNPRIQRILCDYVRQRLLAA